MAQIIGLTGGIGSGKTTIAHYFSSLGIPVYIADIEARKLMQLPSIIKALKTSFGEDFFDGKILNREKMANLVFNNPEKLKQLNAIIHPAVKSHFEQWCIANKNVPFIIYESAILFESDSYKNFDKIITITAPLETRIERVLQRDKTTREKVIERINSQWTDEQKIAKSDFSIENTDLKTAKLKVNEILKILRKNQ